MAVLASCSSGSKTSAQPDLAKYCAAARNVSAVAARSPYLAAVLQETEPTSSTVRAWTHAMSDSVIKLAQVAPATLHADMQAIGAALRKNPPDHKQAAAEQARIDAFTRAHCGAL